MDTVLLVVSNYARFQLVSGNGSTRGKTSSIPNLFISPEESKMGDA
jgi:hypothetical protein